MQQNVPSPEGYGWIKSGEAWMPVWILLPEAAKASRELLKCGCKAKPLCSRKCSHDAGLSCTALCQCGGLCEPRQLNFLDFFIYFIFSRVLIFADICIDLTGPRK